MTHACAATGCETPVSVRSFMCPRHWALLPPKCKRDYVHSRNVLAAPEAHARAICRAVRAVEEAEAR